MENLEEMEEQVENSNGEDLDFDQVEIDAGKHFKKYFKSFIKPATPHPNSQSSKAPGRDDMEYNMNYKRRGKAVIFNHLEFQDTHYSRREGTQIDVENLEKCLGKLCFDVKIYDNLSKSKIEKKLEKLKGMDHSEADCLLIIVLSHGEEDSIQSYDLPYEPEMLWDGFTSDKCPSLAGKPKIFLIQACKGSQLDAGTHIQGCANFSVTDSKNMTHKNNYRIPNRSDFLVVFSTYPGYYSFRRESTGSWFISAFVETLEEFWEKKDLLSIMTIVTRRVGIDYESININYRLHMKKQIPFLTSTLTREIYFRPKESQ